MTTDKVHWCWKQHDRVRFSTYIILHSEAQTVTHPVLPRGGECRSPLDPQTYEWKNTHLLSEIHSNTFNIPWLKFIKYFCNIGLYIYDSVDTVCVCLSLSLSLNPLNMKGFHSPVCFSYLTAFSQLLWQANTTHQKHNPPSDLCCFFHLLIVGVRFMFHHNVAITNSSGQEVRFALENQLSNTKSKWGRGE